jgi:hypothetical protein
LSCGGLKPLTSVSTTPLVIESQLNKEQVWSNLVDYLALSGATIKIIDKSSGLITTEDYSFMNSWTWENKKGVVENPNQYVVVKRGGGYPTTITGQWNVRIKDNPLGGTTTNVNIVNLKAYHETRTKYGTTYYNWWRDCKLNCVKLKHRVI